MQIDKIDETSRSLFSKDENPMFLHRDAFAYYENAIKRVCKVSFSDKNDERTPILSDSHLIHSKPKNLLPERYSESSSYKSSEIALRQKLFSIFLKNDHMFVEPAFHYDENMCYRCGKETIGLEQFFMVKRGMLCDDCDEHLREPPKKMSF